MFRLESITTTGIYRNEEVQCFEAWAVCPHTGDRILVATCSMGVAARDFSWWEQQVWSEWMPAWGSRRAIARVA